MKIIMKLLQCTWLSTGFLRTLAKVTVPESEAYRISWVLCCNKAVTGVSLIYFCEPMYDKYL